MKNSSLSRGAVCALLLALALSGSVAMVQDASAEPTTGDTPVTNVVPAPPAAPRTIVPAQTKALQDAIKDKNWNAARAAITAGADVNIADKGGITPLMRAADASQSGLVDLLLQNGANPNAADKKGQTALHYAIPADPKPKKKFGLGDVMGALGTAQGVGGALSGGMGNFGSLLGSGGVESLMGSNLTSLLGGGPFSLAGKSGWSAIAGAALQGDTGGNFGINQLLGGGGILGAGGQLNALSAGNWTNLLSSVKGTNPQILTAMSNLGAGTSAGQSALWNQFLNAASSGNQTLVTQLMQNPDLAPLLQQATAGLGAAAGELPGNASRTIVSTLIKSGANTEALDTQGKTAAALAQDRGLTDFAPLFAVN
ncbi:ankyrin repeat domain-containing protein [bacterium]|nr:MAG: ankyrin repeat domain-containing protein [bacterium]